jgi:hypothetical protein
MEMGRNGMRPSMEGLALSSPMVRGRNGAVSAWGAAPLHCVPLFVESGGKIRGDWVERSPE